MRLIKHADPVGTQGLYLLSFLRTDLSLDPNKRLIRGQLLLHFDNVKIENFSERFAHACRIMNSMRTDINRLRFQTQRQRLTCAIHDRTSFRKDDPLLEMLPFPESFELFPLENLKLKCPSRGHNKKHQEEHLGNTQAQTISVSGAFHGKTITWPLSGGLSPKRRRDIASKRSGEVNVAISTFNSRFSC